MSPSHPRLLKSQSVSFILCGYHFKNTLKVKKYILYAKVKKTEWVILYPEWLSSRVPISFLLLRIQLATSFKNSTGFPTEIVSHWTNNPGVHIAHILHDLSKFQMSCLYFQSVLVPFHSTVCHSDRPVLIASVFLDCSMIDEHSTLNDGLGEGVSYRYIIL